MKSNRFSYVLIISFLVLGLHSLYSQEWSEEIAVELPGQPLTTTPDFDIDPYNGHLHIVTMITTHGVLYTEMDKYGNVFRQEQIESAANDGAKSGERFGATVSVDPLGNPHICYREYTGSEKYSTFYTYWNGASWSAPL